MSICTKYILLKSIVLGIEDKFEIFQKKKLENLSCPLGNQPPESGSPEQF